MKTKLLRWTFLFVLMLRMVPLSGKAQETNSVVYLSSDQQNKTNRTPDVEVWQPPESDPVGFPIPTEPPDQLAEPSKEEPTAGDVGGDRHYWYRHTRIKDISGALFINLDPDTPRGSGSLKALAENNDPAAQRVLGYWYDIHTNFVEALSWYGKSTQQGDRVAQVMSAQVRKLMKDQKAAQLGNPEAQWTVGEAYLCRGWIGEAAKWFERGAAQQQRECVNRLSQITEFRENVRKVQDVQRGLGSVEQMVEKWQGLRGQQRQQLADVMDRIAQFIGYEAANTVEAEAWFYRADGLGYSSAKAQAERIAQTPTYFSKLSETYAKALQGDQDAKAEIGMHLIGDGDDTETGLQLEKQAAESGSSFAQFFLAEEYESGDKLPKNMQEALKWYIAVADKNREQAQMADLRVKIAIIYRDGLAGENNPREAEKWLLRATDTGELDAGKGEAMFLVSALYRDGRLGPRDLKRSDEWMAKAAEAGDDLAKLFLKQVFNEGSIETELNTNDFTDVLGRPAPTTIRKEVRDWIVKEANAGNAQAQSCLGLAYISAASTMAEHQMTADEIAGQRALSLPASLTGEVQKNYSQGTNWLIKAAAQGERNAEYKLGDLYTEGFGVDKDLTEAGRWYQLAAKQGHIMATMKLAFLYRNGDGLPINGNEAFKLFSEAATRIKNQCDRIKSEMEKSDLQLQLVIAQNCLGSMARDGEGVPQDIVEAYAWFNLAAANGNVYAQEERDKLAKKLSAEELIEGQSRSAKFYGSTAESNPNEPKLSNSVKDLQATATGFFITEDGYLISNYHVIKDAVKVRLLTSRGTVDAKVVQGDAANDLALLKAVGQFEALPVASSRTVALGGTVATVGFPDPGLQGFSPKLAKGEIAALAGAGDDPRYFQISVPVQPGNSGGALVDDRGNVIGIVSAKLDASVALAASGALPENVNYAVKSSFLLSFLESVPAVSAKLKAPNTKDEKFEDVVKSAQSAAVLVLVY